MATDETAKRSNCNHESNRCHALTTASTLMKRILNRVKWFFKVMQGMSSDRPRAVRYTENDKRGNIFSQEVRYRATKTGILQKTKTCNNSQAPDNWPSSRKNTKIKQRTQRKTRAAGTAVHNPHSPAEAWHVHLHPKTFNRVRPSARRIRKAGETRAPTQTQGTVGRKCHRLLRLCDKPARTARK